MTISDIKDKYPDIYNEIGKEAVEKERERLKAIDEISEILPKEMVEKAKYTDCISAAELAFNAVKADNGIGKVIFDNIVSDNSQSGVKEVNSQDSLSEISDEKEKRVNRLAGFMNKGGRR